MPTRVDDPHQRYEAVRHGDAASGEGRHGPAGHRVLQILVRETL